ncbi:MAG TPA: HTTM domain-containing protein [Acidimicrobiia bacterium]|nr:HTTM domain-containing protein [Acidimicrobiia bacterium]
MLKWLTDEIDPRPLGLARIAVGLAAVIRSLVAMPVLLSLTRDEIILLPYAGWVPTPTPSLVMVILALWLVSAVLFTIGWRLAISGTALAVSIAFVLALDQQAYSNHLYLMLWLTVLLTIARAGTGLAVGGRNQRVVRWPVTLIMAQLAIVYGFSGLSKINDGFLSGSVLAGSLEGGVLPFPEALITPRFLSILAFIVIVVEVALALLIWRARYRPLMFLLGLGLHVSIVLLMSATGELLVFSIMALGLYPLFLTHEPLEVTWPSDCERCVGFIRRARRLDLFGVVDASGNSSQELALTHHGRLTSGGAARTRILEHLVPWLWVAPVLRFPGFNRIHHRHSPSLPEASEEQRQ